VRDEALTAGAAASDVCACDVESEVQCGNNVHVGNCIMMPNGLLLVMEELPSPQTIFMSSLNSKE
jgi:hypothetical protein